MGKIQKVYTREFKEEAVRLAETSGKPIAQIARELGISDSAIHGWRKELAEHGKEAFPGKVLEPMVYWLFLVFGEPLRKYVYLISSYAPDLQLLSVM